MARRGVEEASDPGPAPAPGWRRRIRWIGAIAGVGLAAAVLVLATAGGDDDPAQAALDTLADPDGHGTGLEAGQSFARVAEHLLDAIDGCDPAADRRCAGLHEASGYAQVLAAHVLGCTAPGRFEARTRFESYLRDVLAVASDAPRLPEPPPPPDCG